MLHYPTASDPDRYWCPLDNYEIIDRTNLPMARLNAEHPTVGFLDKPSEKMTDINSIDTLTQLIITKLAEDDTEMGNYVRADDPNSVVIDGTFDVSALAAAILEAVER